MSYTFEEIKFLAFTHDEHLLVTDINCKTWAKMHIYMYVVMNYLTKYTNPKSAKYCFIYLSSMYNFPSHLAFKMCKITRKSYANLNTFAWINIVLHHCVFPLYASIVIWTFMDNMNLNGEKSSSPNLLSFEEWNILL